MSDLGAQLLRREGQLQPTTMNLVDSAKILFLSLKVAGAGNRFVILVCRLPDLGLVVLWRGRAFNHANSEENHGSRNFSDA